MIFFLKTTLGFNPGEALSPVATALQDPHAGQDWSLSELRVEAVLAVLSIGNAISLVLFGWLADAWVQTCPSYPFPFELKGMLSLKIPIIES